MSTTIFWSANTDPYVASYTIERSTSSTGSYVYVQTVTHDLTGSNFDTINNLFFYVDTAGTEASWYRIKSTDTLNQSSPYTLPFQPAGTEPGLVSLAELKSLLSLSTGSTSDDTLLQSLIDAASNFVETQTGRSFAAKLYTESYNGDGYQHIRLQQPKVLSIVSVVDNGVEINPRTSVTASDGYGFIGQQIYYRPGFSRGFANITVSYVAGYQVVPNDIKQCVLWLAASQYRERTRIGAMSTSVGGESVSYQTLTFPAHITQTLDGYKRMPRFM